MYGFGISYHGANDTKPIWSHFVSFPITPKLADVLESCQSYLPSVFDKKQTHIGESSTNKNSFHLHLKYHSSSHCYLTRSNIHITDSSVCFINPGSTNLSSFNFPGFFFYGNLFSKVCWNWGTSQNLWLLRIAFDVKL